MYLIQALMNNGSAETREEAIKIVEEMKESVYDGADPEILLEDYGLEPDYVFDILDV